ncbi:MAG: hypothetical protein H0V83_07835, partial [Rubrobacter sp.]|nr:hypothetical protein [Rubrobacter sp.]
RLFQTMGEIATEQNSTIILPIPMDLLRPYLDIQSGSDDDYSQSSRRQRREDEEKEAEKLYQEVVGDVTAETPDATPDDTPDETPASRETS